MNHLYRAEAWEANGRFYVNDNSDLGAGKITAKWWVPARILGISLTDYILLLKDKYHANHFHYSEERDVLTFSFDTLTEARAFKNYINAQARAKKVYL